MDQLLTDLCPETASASVVRRAGWCPQGDSSDLLLLVSMRFLALQEGNYVTPEEKLQELGIELPEVGSRHPAMALGVITGNLLYLSGATPRGELNKPWKGRVGETYSVDEGYQAAREVAIQQLARAKAVLGHLSRIQRVVKVLGMVNCSPGFSQTSQVMHGFSELIYEVLGERGVHARSAVGVQALPFNAPIEVETIFEIE